jgi:acyl-coenzyme A synthetase/AMP-(fatty) acid ligase
MNVTNTIWRNCNAYPDRIAILYDGHPLSYRALRAAVERASARLAATGVARGDVVALSIRNKMSYLIVLLAVARLGAVAIPLSKYREELAAESRIHSIVLDKDDGWRSSDLPALHYLEARLLLASLVDGERFDVPPVAQGLDEQPWVIWHTSGTTGRPKKNPQTHAHSVLLASLSPRVNRDDEERVYVLVSLGTEYGITMLMRQLYGSATTVLTQSTKPEDFYAVVQRDRPTRVVTTTGNASVLVAHAAKAVPESSVTCASIRSMSIGGGFASPALQEGIEQRICSRLEVAYGSTETGILAISTPETRAARPKSAGRLMTWVQAEAVDENNQPLPHGQPGVLRFKSPALAAGYLDDEQATARAFRNGWFYPGDTGSVGAAGYLSLSGRIDHVLNLGGDKIDPRLIEELLDEQPEIIASAVVVVNLDTGVPVLVAAVEALAPFDSEALKRLCHERLGRRYKPDAIVQIDALPRDETGKVMRSALAASLKISSKNATTTRGTISNSPDD